LRPNFDRPPSRKSSQTPLFLTLANLGSAGDFGNFRAAAKGHLQTAPLYRAENPTPINTSLWGGPCTPTLGRVSGPLPACVWIGESRNALGLKSPLIRPPHKKRRIIVFFDLKQAPTIGLKWRVEIFGVSFFHFFFRPRHRCHYFSSPAAPLFFVFVTLFWGLVTDATISWLQTVPIFCFSFLFFMRFFSLFWTFSFFFAYILDVQPHPSLALI
jgi:hypothetical protein